MKNNFKPLKYYYLIQALYFTIGIIFIIILSIYKIPQFPLAGPVMMWGYLMIHYVILTNSWKTALEINFPDSYNELYKNGIRSTWQIRAFARSETDGNEELKQIKLYMRHDGKIIILAFLYSVIAMFISLAGYVLVR